MSKNARLRKLKKHLLENKNLTWVGYQKRFTGTRPLKLWTTEYYPRKWEVEPAKWDTDISPYDIGSSAYIIRKLDQEYKIIAGYKGKATKEEIQDVPYLECSVAINSPRYLLHKSVIDIMQQICPEDFEAIPVTIVNERKNSEYFEIKDFYAINLLKCIDAIDRKTSTIQWSSNNVAHLSRLSYKANPWQDGAIRVPHKQREEKYHHFHLEKPCKMAIDVVTGAYLWHPELVKELPCDSFHWFVQDVDQFCWSVEKDPTPLKKSPVTLFEKVKNFIKKTM
jgi:hypothetical protein